MTIVYARVMHPFQIISEFVLGRADLTARYFGFTFVGTEDAPNDYDTLYQLFRHSRHTGAPLPVSSLNCEDTIYTSPQANMAFRFWHDVSHCVSELTFSGPDEIDLARSHLASFTISTGRKDDLVYSLFKGEVLGQAMYGAITGDFVTNQRRFVTNCASNGIDTAILWELDRQREGGLG